MSACVCVCGGVSECVCVRVLMYFFSILELRNWDASSNTKRIIMMSINRSHLINPNVIESSPG